MNVDVDEAIRINLPFFVFFFLHIKIAPVLKMLLHNLGTYGSPLFDRIWDIGEVTVDYSDFTWCSHSDGDLHVSLHHAFKLGVPANIMG